MNPLRLTLSLLCLLTGLSVSATDSSFVNIRFVSPLSTDKFTVTLHDGISEHKLKVSEQLNWNGELFSPYGLIQIDYKDSDSTYIYKRIFFPKGRSVISLTSEPDPAKYYSVDEKNSENIVMYDALGGAAMDAFVKPDLDKLYSYYHKNKHRIGADTSVVNRAFALGDSVALAEIAFIRQNPQLYVSYWTLLTRVIKTKHLSPAQLKEFYDTKVPESIKNTKSGTYLANQIQTKINISSQQLFPDFDTKDLNGQPVVSSALRGKLVLIQFWASWCRPCMEEMPEMKKINEKYSDSPFKLISFSIDKDSLACRKAIEKNAMNWTQVYGDNKLYNDMSYYPIPQLYLIDKTGRTIYNSTIVRDNDLHLLNKILSEQLGK
ncbi:TlpA family protein disulfide reductase [Chitinophaga rhizosphaerae]|uniref:TlpA family protein disulfide reductase n=1 Tax=Chitinophaga rhizosphaerae TaxID=1864947 RepID=UPI000F80963B|nr:TlpA disulfide reductase family protein [Chitinophaga rhizosphaerae]